MPKPEESNEELDVRGQLALAFDKAEESDDKSTTDVETGVDGLAGDGADKSDDDTRVGDKDLGKPAAKPDADADKLDGAEGAKKSLPEKDEKGKFKAKEKEVSVEDKDVKTEVQLPKSRAPGNWKPTAREKWASLPAEIQQEVVRREREIANGFNEVAQVKKFHQDFGGITAQHSAIIAAEGGDALKMTRDLFQTASTLYHGSPDSKARTVAAMIRNFSVDIQMLDSLLANQATSGSVSQQGNSAGQADAGQYIRQIIQQELAPVLGRQSKETQAVVDQDIDAFAADPKNEFFDDVREDMADLLEVAANRGKKLTLQDAYNAATMANTEIANVINERKLREGAEAKSTAAAAARKKAVSVRNTPAKDLATGEDGESQSSSVRGDLLASIDALSG